MNADDTEESESAGRPGRDRSRLAPLSKREREVFGLLAEGLSGAQIARELVLSPETVRTHIRNGMAKLGASTRSQAVVLALRRREISLRPEPDEAPTASAAAPSEDRRASPEEVAAALGEAMDGLLSLWDVDAGWVYLADDGGLSLSQVVERIGADAEPLPATIALGEGALGRAALERRAQVLQATGAETGAMLVAPLIDSGRLIGVLGLAIRSSRPTGRQEQLLLQALAGRIAELIASGSPQINTGIADALSGFRSSWAATTRH